MSDITPDYLTEIRVYPESVIAKAMCAIPSAAITWRCLRKARPS
jgi:hypothetical protein